MGARKKLVRVGVVIPAFNEASSIGTVVTKARKVFNKSPYDVEIIVVDDGSKDTTAKVAAQKGATVIRHVLNSGTGGATATGLAFAHQSGMTIAATMDADGQHDPADVLRGVMTILESDVDLLIGSRLIDSTGMSRLKVLGNKGLSFITYLIFRTKTTDSQSGLRVFSSKSLAQLRWKTSGYEFCSEMLWRAKQQGLIIDEFSIKAIYTDYSKAKGQSNWNAVNIIKSLVKRRIAELLG